MKKICSVLLALLLVLTTLSGCSSLGEKDAKSQAGEIIENYLTALMQFDFKTASKLTVNPEKMMKNAPYESMDAGVTQIVNAMPEQFRAYESDIREFATALFDVMLNNMSYTITNLEQVDDKFVATVQMTTVHSENFDMQTILTDMMSTTDLQGLLTQYMENGTITEEMSEQELYDIIFPAMFDKMTETIKDIPVETTTDEETFDIVLVDGNWLIDVSDI